MKAKYFLKNIFPFLALVLFIMVCRNRTYAAEEDCITDIVLENSDVQEDGSVLVYAPEEVKGDGYRFQLGFYVMREVSKEETLSVTITSSNETVAKPAKKKSTLTLPGDDGFYRQELNFTGEMCGVADITLRIGSYYKTFQVFATSEEPQGMPVRASVKAHDMLAIDWDAATDVAGYQVYCYKKDPKYSQITLVDTGTVKGADHTEYAFTGDTGYTYAFVVFPYVEFNSEIAVCFRPEEFSLNEEYYNYAECEIPAYEFSLTGIKTSVGRAVLTWKSYAKGMKYAVYESTSEEGTYHKVATTTKTKYTYKGKSGITHYFKVMAYKGKIKAYSAIISAYIPLKKTAGKAVYKLTSLKMTAKDAQYNMMFASSSDTTYLYEKNGALHIVCYKNECLRDYTLTASHKVKSVKTVKLGNITRFGAFYYGKDGKYYVAVGYHNPKESKTKTVIKVYQYDSNWKKCKTADIKGSASNVHEGIYSPFIFANCRMDMTGNSLYLFTGRKMFAIDGTNHQSDIGFVIDTKTMTASDHNLTYVSHSFNQFIRIQNGEAYQADHGDAYPRAVQITVTHNYGLETEESDSYCVFDIEGEIGDNSTGLKLGGMEVGTSNILTAGVSTPQNYSVKGVSENDSNVFLCVTNKVTGKTCRKWLTTYNMEGNTYIKGGECRLLKLSDDRFVILYTTLVRGKNQTRLHYVLLNNAGKVLCHKTYRNMVISGAIQPILYQGNICWMEKEDSDSTPCLYSIPVVEE